MSTTETKGDRAKEKQNTSNYMIAHTQCKKLLHNSFLGH